MKKTILMIFLLSLLVSLILWRIIIPFVSQRIHPFVETLLVFFLPAFLIALPALVFKPLPSRNSFFERFLLFLGLAGMVSIAMRLVFLLNGCTAVHWAYGRGLPFFTENPGWVTGLVLTIATIPLLAVISCLVLVRVKKKTVLPVIFFVSILFSIAVNRYVTEIDFRIVTPLIKYCIRLSGRTEAAPREVVEEFLQNLKNDEFDSAEKYIGVDTITIIGLQTVSFTRHDFVRWLAPKVQGCSVGHVEVEG